MSVFTKRAQQIFASADENGNARAIPEQEVGVWGTEVEREFDIVRSEVNAELGVVRQEIEAAAEGLVQNETWTELASINGTRNGQPGRVTGPDTGTHVDPMTGETVGNTGEYSWSSSPTGWKRVGEVLVKRSSSPGANFVDELGFIGAQIDDTGALRTLEEDRTYELNDTRSDDEFLAVTDPLGFKSLSLTANGLKAKGLSSEADVAFNEGFSASPLIGGTLVAFEGAETHLYIRNVMTDRSDVSRYRGTFYSEAAIDGTRSAYSRLGDDDLVLDLRKSGPTGYLQTRLSEVSSDLRHQVELSVVTVPVAPGSLNTASVLMIGDSITNRQLAAYVEALSAFNGYDLSLIGTLNASGIDKISSDATGPLGEAREGWQFGDFTYSIIDRVTIVAPGDEAAYMSADKAAKWPQNPFLRVSSGGDDPSVIRNGHVFDFDFYLSRFSLPTPDLVFIGLGTNDVRDLDSPDLGPAITDGLTIICSQIQSARPGTKIIIWFPPISRSSDRDSRWDEYVEVLSRTIAFVRQQASADVRLIPIWAMASQEVGFSLSAGATSDLGVQTAPLSDAVHLYRYNITTVAEILAAAAAGAAQGLL
ncbi:MAG TPA: SGNH/GDSL hydrolase family protein [Pseudorhizobium sp.]|jgi:hypothetical protein|nr:SGNH/GDSL hydrolase family protein [Pseudorhizobium sp.]